MPYPHWWTPADIAAHESKFNTEIKQLCHEAKLFLIGPLKLKNPTPADVLKLAEMLYKERHP